MTWFPITLIVLLAVSALNKLKEVDEPREPYTFEIAFASIIFNALLIVGIAHYFL